MKKEILYGFYYCSCVQIYPYVLISLHRFENNANTAMIEHKNQAKKEWVERCVLLKKKHGVTSFIKFGEHEDWLVKPIEIID